jgi:hypothetical protein
MKGRNEEGRRFVLEPMIAELRSGFAGLAHGGGFLSVDDVSSVLRILDLINDEAVAMRNALSAARWNARAASDAQVEVILAEARRPGGTVVLFPVVARPAFCDGRQGHPEGGAA